MRILLFTTAYRPLIGGSELAIEAIARHLPDVSFDIVTPRYSLNVPMRETSGNVSVFRAGLGLSIDKFLFPKLGAVVGLLLIWKRKYNAIHAYQASYGAGAAVIVRLLTGIPMILTLQEGKDLDKQYFFVKIFRRFIIWQADRITAISGYLKNYILSLRPGIPVELIPNGVEYERFADQNLRSHLDIRARLGIDVNQFIIMTVSRLVPKNGVAGLISALKILRKTVPVSLVIAGDGYLHKELERLAGTEGVKDHVYFLGSISRHDLPKYLACADVFVRTPLSEGMGSAFLEAMAAGIPIVGSSVGGITDFLKDGETGMIAHQNDPENIAGVIIKLLENSDLRHKLSENGRRLVREKYQWQHIAQRMRKMYENIEHRT